MKTARLLLLLLLTTTTVLAQAPGEDRALAWVRTFNSGSAEAMEAFAQANYTAEGLQRFDASRRRSVYEQLLAAHGRLRVIGVAADNGDLRVRVEPERGEPLTLHFAIEPAPPHRISAMRINVGGGRGEERGPKLPPLDLPKNDFAGPLAAYLSRLPDFTGTVLVAKNGEVQFEKAYGLANRSANVPNEITTRYNLGSITKDFTKVAIGQLAQAGKVDVHSPVIRYLPNYPNKEVARKITVQQLIDHTSGLGDIFTPRFRDVNKDQFSTPQHFIDFFASDPLKFEPGKGRAYSNYGYVVLGAIIEAVSGQSYFDYVQKNVFDRAGMKASGFFDRRALPEDTAIGYIRDGGQWRENTSTRPSVRGIPAGGSYSSARDLLLFDRALRGGKLLDETWTRWFFHGDDPNSAAGVWAGGSPGVNAAVAGDGTWTVIVLTNTDPPLAEKLAERLHETLR